jgi:hypothetical protein
VQRGARGARRGDGIVDVLLADGLVVAQRAVAVAPWPRPARLALALSICGDLIARGAVDARVDQIERLARLHIAAFLEQALADDAVDLRAHIGGGRRGDAPGQFGGQLRLGARQCHIAHLGWPALGHLAAPANRRPA